MDFLKNKKVSYNAKFGDENAKPNQSEGLTN